MLLLGALLLGAPLPALGQTPPNRDASAEVGQGGLCKAQLWAQRKEAEGRRRGLMVTFAKVTTETIYQARAITAAFWQARLSRWLEDGRERATRLHREAAARHDEPASTGASGVGRRQCQQMARPTRDGCDTLGDDTARHCRLWQALLAAREEPRRGCAELGAWAPACLLLLTGDESACAGADRVCASARTARRPLAQACARDAELSACRDALLLRGLREGVAVCEAVAGRKRASWRRIHQLCTAVLGGEPSRCPADPKVGVGPHAASIRAMVAGGGEGPRLLLWGASAAPSVCFVEVELEDSAGHRLERVVEVLTVPEDLRASETRVERPLDPARVDPFSTRVSVRSTCVGRYWW